VDTITRELDLTKLILKSGGHSSGTDMCLMEAVAYIAGEPWTDRPSCSSPVLAAYGRTLNDRMPDTARQLLKPLIPRLLGTAGNIELDTRRAYLAVNRILHQLVPARLERRGKPELATRLREIPDIVDLASARHARTITREVRAAAADAAYAAAADVAAAAAAYAAADAADAADAAYAAAADDAADAAYAAAADAAAAAAAYAAADAADAWQPSIDLFIELIELT